MYMFDQDHRLGAQYAVTLPAFRGPLDLLLQLIEKQELDIDELSLVAVTDQYLQTIERLEEIEPGALADFLVVASRLLFLKSRQLLPKPLPPLDEEEEDAGEALIRQLLEYRRFKEVASTLQVRQDEGLRVYIRSAPRPEFERQLDLSNVDLDRLQVALQRALERIPDDPPLPRVKTYQVTVADQIESVRDFVAHVQLRYTDGSVGAENKRIPVAFTDLLRQSSTRLEVIVTFLAVLELIKLRELEAIQQGTFGEIALVPAAHDQGGSELTLDEADPSADQ
jgi:segregation and condensation protein A